MNDKVIKLNRRYDYLIKEIEEMLKKNKKQSKRGDFYDLFLIKNEDSFEDIADEIINYSLKSDFRNFSNISSKQKNILKKQNKELDLYLDDITTILDKVDIAKRKKKNKSFLDMIKYGDIRGAKKYINSKNPLNINKGFETPLGNAIIYEQPEIAELLIKKGVDINFIDMYGQTYLYDAISHEQPEIAKLLIKKGIQP